MRSVISNKYLPDGQLIFDVQCVHLVRLLAMNLTRVVRICQEHRVGSSSERRSQCVKVTMSQRNLQWLLRGDQCLVVCG